MKTEEWIRKRAELNKEIEDAYLNSKFLRVALLKTKLFDLDERFIETRNYDK